MAWYIPNLQTTYLLGNFGSINQSCQFKLKFGTYNNLNLQNSMVMFTFLF